MKKIIAISILIFAGIFFAQQAHAFIGRKSYNYGSYYVSAQTLVIIRHKVKLTTLSKHKLRVVSPEMVSIFLKMKQLTKEIDKNMRNESKVLDVNAISGATNSWASGVHIKETVIAGFKVDSAVLTAGMKDALNLIPKDNIVSITGYTDRFGSKKYNDELAIERAKSAEEYLNIHIKIFGHGKCCYASKINRLNRRIIVKLKQED